MMSEGKMEGQKDEMNVVEGKMEGQKDEMNVVNIQIERTESGKSQQDMRIFAPSVWIQIVLKKYLLDERLVTMTREERTLSYPETHQLL